MTELTIEKAREIYARFGEGEISERLSPDEFLWAHAKGFIDGYTQGVKELRGLIQELNSALQATEVCGNRAIVFREFKNWTKRKELNNDLIKMVTIALLKDGKLCDTN